MTVDVRIADPAREAVHDLDEEAHNRIVSRMKDAADFPDHYLDPLTNGPGYKLRVGDFRIIVDWDRTNDVLYVVAVLKRKHDYRELPDLRKWWGTWRE